MNNEVFENYNQCAECGMENHCKGCVTMDKKNGYKKGLKVTVTFNPF